jgi:hypothetical protein
MKPFLDALRRYLDIAVQALVVAWKASIKWLSVPVNLCLAVLGLVFVVSVASWALGDAFEEAVLFFPDQKGILRGELHNVSHSPGGEARAELIASEILLGPKNGMLLPAFESDVRVESAIYRKGRLFIDISPDAALAPTNSLRNGIKAMNRSLKAALPGLKRLSLTIGGKEPYVVDLKGEMGKGIKKTGK